MPMGSKSPARASSVRWLAVVICLVLARSQGPTDGSSLQHPLISSRSLIWRGAMASSWACEATMEVDKKLGRSGSYVSADRDVLHQPWRVRWSFAARRCGRRAVFVSRQWSYAARICGRWAVLVASSWFLLTEWRSLLFLPAWKPKGRQHNFWMEFTACGCRRGGDLVAPSGYVPGCEVQSSRRLFWTRLHFFLPVGGPLCNCQGPVCILQFLLGPVVKCFVLLFPILNKASGSFEVPPCSKKKKLFLVDFST